MLAAEPGEINDPHLRVPRVLVEAELLLVEKRFDQAVSIVIDTLRDLEPSEDAVLTANLCWLGLRIVADRAAQPTHYAATGEDELSWIADHIPSLKRGGRRGGGESLAAYVATAKAEESRARHKDNWGTWQSAADLWRHACQPWELAYCRLREAEQGARRRLGQHAAEALSEASRIASEISAQPLLDAAEALARGARLRIDEPRPAEPPPAPMPLGLTSREHEVCLALAKGATNREIAATLYISERTAAVHVSNILRKLGVKSRLEAGLIAQDFMRQAGNVESRPT
jgi:DNA-binding CsgD family transcriptional regulator